MVSAEGEAVQLEWWPVNEYILFGSGSYRENTLYNYIFFIELLLIALMVINSEYMYNKSIQS
jgi:hypothetical protein